MCSSPKPRRIVKVKATPRVVSIMASMDEEARHRFTERANQAAERKEIARQEQKALRLLEQRKNDSLQYQDTLLAKQQNKGVSYWLFSASFTEIFKKLITGH